jgi:hypothetical protein
MRVLILWKLGNLDPNQDVASQYAAKHAAEGWRGG